MMGARAARARLFLEVDEFAFFPSLPFQFWKRVAEGVPWRSEHAVSHHLIHRLIPGLGRWTPEEDALLLKLKESDLSAPEIGKRLNRQSNDVIWRWRDHFNYSSEGGRKTEEFSEAEWDHIRRMLKKAGCDTKTVCRNGPWRAIANTLEKRTAQQCSRRWGNKIMESFMEKHGWKRTSPELHRLYLKKLKKLVTRKDMVYSEVPFGDVLKTFTGDFAKTFFIQLCHLYLRMTLEKKDTYPVRPLVKQMLKSAKMRVKALKKDRKLIEEARA